MPIEQVRRRSDAITNREAAARLRAGESLADIVADTKIRPSTLEKRLQDAGWGSNGHPLSMFQAPARFKPCGRCGRKRGGNHNNGIPDICVDCKDVVLDLGEAEMEKWGVERPKRHGLAGKPSNNRRVEVQHGTRRGRDQHMRRGEKPCDPCREAYNKYKRDLRAAGRAA